MFSKKVLKAFGELKIPENAVILVSFSGGPDSTALLHWMNSISSKHPINIYAFYLNHGLRSVLEMEQEIRIVKELCGSFKIEIFIKELPHGELQTRAKTEKKSIEALARNLRYQYLKDYASKIEAQFIALGHNYDDYIETMLMRLFGGSGFAGLTGIPVKRGPFIRPLIYCTKQEIMDYLCTHNLHYSIDKSNLSDDYLRNRIRHRLIPVIKDIFPGFQKGLFQFSKKMGDVKAFIEDQGKQLASFEKISLPQPAYRILWKEFVRLPNVLKWTCFYDIYHKLAVKRQDESSTNIPFRFLQPLLTDNPDITKNILLKGYGIVVYRVDDYLFFKSDIVYPEKKGYLITITRQPVKAQEFYFSTNNFILNILGNVDYNQKKESGILLNNQLLQYPIVIRSRRAADVVRMQGFKKSIKKLFIDWKIPEPLKGEIPIIADSGGIIAIIGKPFGYKNVIIPEHDMANIINIDNIILIELKQKKWSNEL